MDDLKHDGIWNFLAGVFSESHILGHAPCMCMTKLSAGGDPTTAAAVVLSRPAQLKHGKILHVLLPTPLPIFKKLLRCRISLVSVVAGTPTAHRAQHGEVLPQRPPPLPPHLRFLLAAIKLVPKLPVLLFRRAAPGPEAADTGRRIRKPRTRRHKIRRGTWAVGFRMDDGLLAT